MDCCRDHPNLTKHISFIIEVSVYISSLFVNLLDQSRSLYGWSVRYVVPAVVSDHHLDIDGQSPQLEGSCQGHHTSNGQLGY